MTLARTLILFLALFFFNTHIIAQDDDTVLTIGSNLIVLNATITDKSGKPAGGLKQEQFKVFEDGKEQTISFFSAEQTSFAAVILIDTSGSMEERVSMARAAAINFLDGLRVGDNAAIYRFDSKVVLIQPFSDSRDVNEKIFEIKADGMTALNDSIFTAAEELAKRPEKRRAIVVLSDGADTISSRSAGKAMTAAQKAAASIYTIDMSAIDSGGRERMQSQSALKNFAEKTGGKFISTPGGASLRQAFKSIVEELGLQYTLSYEPTDLKKDGKWRSIELLVSRPNLTIRTRRGYTASK